MNSEMFKVHKINHLLLNKNASLGFRYLNENQKVFYISRGNKKHKISSRPPILYSTMYYSKDLKDYTNAILCFERYAYATLLKTELDKMYKDSSIHIDCIDMKFIQGYCDILNMPLIIPLNDYRNEKHLDIHFYRPHDYNISKYDLY